jgi:myo-inositol-1(or 4)-monophosphatase
MNGGELAMSKSVDPQDLLYLDAALALAAEAGALLLSAGGRAQQTESKSAAIDLVTRFDKASEDLIVRGLSARFPGHRILAEEGGDRGGDPEAPRWIVDPLDGTTNFAHGLPFFAVSIACEARGVLRAGVVAAPALGWTFAAARGAGARRNGQPIAVSATAEVGQALLATGFPYDRRTSQKNNFAQFLTLKRQAQGVRRFGAAALDLSLVATGWLDGYWEMKLNPWDLAAGVLLVEEAGGRTSGWAGEATDIHSGQVVATNGHIHDELLGILGKVSDGVLV